MIPDRDATRLKVYFSFTSLWMKQDTSVGSVIWGKMKSHPWWPGIPVNGKDCHMPSAQEGYIWIIWFGDHKISKIPTKNILPFFPEFVAQYERSNSKRFKDAVQEALMVVADRLLFDCSSTDIETLVEWAKKDFPLYNKQMKQPPPGCLKRIPKSLMPFLDIESGYFECCNSYSDSSNSKKPRLCDMDTLGEISLQKEESRDENSTCISYNKDIAVGSVVWGKLKSHPWWPGIPIYGKDCSKPSAQKGFTWIIWFGDYKISKVSTNNILPFLPEFEAKYKGSNNKYFKKAINESLMVVADRLQFKYNHNEPESLVKWAIEKSSSHNKKGMQLPPEYVKNVPNCLKPYLEVKSENFKYSDSDLQPSIIATTESETGQCFESAHLNEEIAVCSNITKDTSLGSVVWGKMKTYPWWPGIPISSENCSKSQDKEGFTWIIWFGDYKISKVSKKNILPFIPEFDLKYTGSNQKIYKVAIHESLMVIADRLKVRHNFENTESLIEWAKKEFSLYNKEGKQSPKYIKRIPNYLKPYLKTDREYFQFLDFNFHSTCSLPQVSQISGSEKECITPRSKCIEDVCIACTSQTSVVVCHHPLFHGGLCEECKTRVAEAMFAYDKDGGNIYCVICAMRRDALWCKRCKRSYCTRCLMKWANFDLAKQIHEFSWLDCLMCNNDRGPIHLLAPRWDFEQKMVSLHVRSSQLPYEKKQIRVLSLFDGIATGYLALKNLGFEIGDYYSSEIDEDALTVTRHHIKNISCLGDVTLLHYSELNKITPIDLVIGGSPCDELSIVNPKRRGVLGVRGSGKLVFEFARVLSIIQKSCNNHVFWLFENVASMSSEDKATITKQLGCEPAVHDSIFFSPQKRKRYFWGNIPGMHSSSYYWKEQAQMRVGQDSYLGKDIHLQNYLGTGREAMMPKIKTVTTSSNSLRQQGKKNTLPVDDSNERLDVISETELERIFGLPDHYTDIPQVSCSRRLKLLGKSWSVPVIQYLLRPLQNFFKTRNKFSY